MKPNPDQAYTLEMVLAAVKALEIQLTPDTDAPYAIGAWSIGPDPDPGNPTRWCLYYATAWPMTYEDPPGEDVDVIMSCLTFPEAVMHLVGNAAKESAMQMLNALFEGSGEEQLRLEEAEPEWTLEQGGLEPTDAELAASDFAYDAWREARAQGRRR